MIKMVEENMTSGRGMYPSESADVTVNRAIEENKIDESKIISISFRKPTCVNIFYRE